MSEDIRVHEQDGVTLAMFARSYDDERGAIAAWERAREKVKPADNTSVFRMRRQSGEHLIVVVSQTAGLARRMRERVAWGGSPCELSGDELRATGARMREVAEADGLQSVTRWGGSGIGLEPGGSTGPIDRPQG